MICKPCRLAADIQTELQDDEWIENKRVQAVATALHHRCKNCDCQHKLVQPGKNVKKTSALS